MKKKIFAVLAAAVLVIVSAVTFVACGNKSPQDPDDKSNVDVFSENSEYKEFYDTVTKIENALFGETRNSSARTTNRIYNAAYNSGKSLSGVASVVNGAMSKLAADEVAGFEPEITHSLYSTYKGMFASSFSLAKQMGDGITRLKNKKNFYNVVMEFQPGNDGNSHYYVIEKNGNHIYQIIYSPELVTTIANTNSNETFNVRQEYFALTDVSYTNDNSFEFSMLTVWGEDEQLSFSYGNSAKRIMYGQSNGNELGYLAWADGDLINGTKQISFGSSEEKCKEMSATFGTLYDYIDKSYVKSIASRKEVSLTQEELDEITAIWAKQAALDQGEDSPWRIEGGVLTGCNFDESTANPSETVIIPENIVMISSNFVVSDKTGTVKNLIIPSSVTQVKRADNNRWQTVDASYFDPRIFVSPSYDDSHNYRFSHIRSESPLFKTDEISGMLLTTNTDEAFYLFDADKSEYDLTGVTISDNICSTSADSRYLNNVKIIKANAKRVYKYADGENKGELSDSGSKVFSYYYDERNVFRIFGDNGINLDLLEIHYGKPCERYFGYDYNFNYDKYIEDIAERLTIRPNDPFSMNMSQTIEATEASEIRKLKIVADGYKYVYISADGGKFDTYSADLKDKTADELQSMASAIENKYTARFNAWKNSDEASGLDKRYLTLEYFLEYSVRDNTARDDMFRYKNIRYYLVFKKKYPGENIYSVIRNVECPDGVACVSDSDESFDYNAYRMFVRDGGEKVINVSGEYQKVYISDNIKKDSYSKVTVNIASTAKFTELKFNDNVNDGNGMPVDNYTYPYARYIVKLPVTKNRFESDELMMYRARILKNCEYTLAQLQTKNYFDDKSGAKYEFAATDGASPLVSNYWVKYEGIVAAYLDETSDSTTITLPADCDTLSANMEFTTKNRLAKVVIPDNYAYYLGQHGKLTSIRDEDVWLFRWDNSYCKEGGIYTNRLKSVEMSDTQPLFKMVGNKVYSKDGVFELKQMIAASSAPVERTSYPDSYVCVTNYFIDNEEYLKYTFENVYVIMYDVTGNVSIDLTLFDGLDPTNLQGINIGKNSVVTNTNFGDFRDISLVFEGTRAKFEQKYTSAKAKELFWDTNVTKLSSTYTYEDFAADDYVFLTEIDEYGNTTYFQFLFSDSVNSEYDVLSFGTDMSQPIDPDAVNGNKLKVIKFYEFESLVRKYNDAEDNTVTAMKYNLETGKKISNVVLYFDVSPTAFQQLCANGNASNFIGWNTDNFAIPSDLDLKALAEPSYEYTDSETGVHIRFLFGNKELTQNPDPTELKPSEKQYTATFSGSTIDFVEYTNMGYSGADYCTEITITNSVDELITFVNYALADGAKIYRTTFNFTKITLQQFLELYTPQHSNVFQFNNTNIFAQEIVFDEPYEQTENTLTFSDCGKFEVKFLFAEDTNEEEI